MLIFNINFMNQLFLMASPEGQQGSPYSSLIFIGLIIVIFYFFMIRPQVKRQKEAKNFKENLQKGDKIITTGGLYGKIVEIQDNFALVEIDTNVKIKIDKGAIAALQSNDTEVKK